MKKQSLTARFAGLLFFAGAGCALLFLVLQFSAHAFMRRWFERPEFWKQVSQSRVERMQDYVSRKKLSSTDRDELLDWANDHQIVMLAVFRGNEPLYAVFVPERRNRQWDAAGQHNSPFTSRTERYPIQFADGAAEVAVYSDPTESYYNTVHTVLLVTCVVLFLVLFLQGSHQFVQYICLLSGEIQAMEGGDLDHPITIRGSDELALLAQSLDSMRVTLRTQQERDAEAAAKMKDLITEMSHDLRTPLTTLLLYTEILRSHRYESEEQLADYLAKIDSKARQLKQLSDNLFEYALVTRDTVVTLDPPKRFSQIFEEPLTEMVDTLLQKEFHCVVELTEEDLLLAVKPPYVKRVLDNITSNLLKYADPEQLIRITSAHRGNGVELAVSNAILAESRQQQSTKVGLSSIQTMMEKMHGQSIVTQTGTEFCITLQFPAQPVEN